MRFKKIIAALLSSALLLSLCACGETDETKIAVIVKSVDSDFWQNFKSGVESAATEYNVSVTFEGPENEENYAEQNKMISRAAENGADVIVLSAIDRTRCAPTVNAAVRSGVRVIAADSALDSPLISLFIGTDNPESGISAAKALEADTELKRNCKRARSNPRRNGACVGAEGRRCDIRADRRFKALTDTR